MDFSCPAAGAGQHVKPFASLALLHNQVGDIRLQAHGLTAAGHALFKFISTSIQRHPKRVTTVLAALMLGGGGGAFAVASLAPDAADLPVREVVEAVQPLPYEPQAALLDVHSFNLFRSDVTRSTDSAQSLLARLGIDDAEAVAFVRNNVLMQKNVIGRAGRSVTAEADDQNALRKLTTRWNSDTEGSFNRLVIEKSAQGFQARVETAPLAASTQLASGTIRTSLFAATDDARIPDAIAINLAEIFSSEIDFHRALRKGDRFSVVYETLEADGEPVRSGRVLSAEFVNNGKTYQAIWFQEPGQKGGYYTLDGQSLRRPYLASPMAFSRMSSGFKMRFHPILQTWRAHLGVDYAAPTGTPVRAVGGGVVDFAGRQGGFGNVVFIKHRNNHTTVYAHLSRINVRKGQNIEQGETLGAVGATGWATGPHLHFEFRVNGVHQDPLTLARQSEAIPVSVAARPLFERAAAAMRPQLAAASLAAVASAQ